MTLDFVIPGAAKCATTWLIRALDEHPKIYAPTHEPRYFSNYWAQPDFDYHSLFREASDEQLIGEKSPCYFVHPEAAKRLAKHSPNVKLFFILRDPVARAQSHYNMLFKGSKISANLRKEVKPDTRIVKDGLYFSNLKPFRATFDDDQISVLLFERLKNEPEDFIRNIYEELGVDTSFKPDILNKRFHQSGPKPRFERIYKLGTTILGWMHQRQGVLDELASSFRTSKLADLIRRLNKGQKAPEFTSELQNKLARYYKTDIRNLSRLLGKPLVEKWIQPYLI